MQLNINSIKSNLKQFGFKKLFIEDLGWNSFSTNLNPFAFNGTEYSFDPVAELSGMAIILCKSSNGIIPPAQIRKRIDREITKLFFEHILIFIDSNKSKSVWLWMKRGIGKSAKSREHTYYSYQTGDSLISKLSQIAFSFEEFENGKAVLTEVAQRVKKAFDADKVTKKFYDLFKKQREKFFGFIKGIKEKEHAEWYTSVMVSRLMFIYFIQKKSFLNNDVDYLSNKLSVIQKHKKDSYYKEFLIPLFFEGFAKKERSAKMKSLLGKIPYLNGGLFLEHQIEQEYKNQIVIPDKAFEELFAFFNQYNWHLDTRDEKDDKEINPDVLGYVFEKYTNQKEMGAYYTKEDITDYICKDTIIPRLFYMLVSNTVTADVLTPFPLTEIEPYIYDAVKTKDYLPTETEREYKERQKRYESIKQDFAEGKICSINDLITYNLDIKKFAQDWIYNNDKPEVLSSFYFDCLKKITILDPTVGSGAFLFAALNILEDLYELCLDKFEEFQNFPSGEGNTRDLSKQIEAELSEIQHHNNREYFIYKTIIVNNLYGVDIMEEATEICKLRLFLKLVAQIDDVNKIEPLPDIDFNIKAGNSLVGFASFEEIKKVFDNPLGLKSDIEILSEELAQDISAYKFESLKSGETDQSKKKVINEKLETLKYALNNYLTGVYKVSRKGVDSFIKNYQPFHWWAEFFDIINTGGFDVVIGNPPYLELKEVSYQPKSFATLATNAIHAMCIERSYQLLSQNGNISMIVPMSIVSTQRMKIVQEIIENSRSTWYSNYAWRPSKLFDTVNRALTIFVSNHASEPKTLTTNYQRWYSEARENLFNIIRYCEVERNRSFFWVPKFSIELENSILRKILSSELQLKNCIQESNHKIYYRTTGGLYWKVFTNFSPAFKVKNKKGHSSRETFFKVKDKHYTNTIIALLSSNLYWWYYTISSNLRDLNPIDIQNFPIHQKILAESKMETLGELYINDLIANSTTLIRIQKQTGKTETQLFKIQKSKPIIDKIDNVLAAHYGFTEDELDFIINYDIKYRMGKDTEESEE